jgi:hypothetical protein
MSDGNDFFGDVFDDPEDDPLLGGGASSGASSSGGEEKQGPPSWMAEDPETNGTASSADESSTEGPEQKKIVVDQDGDDGASIDALNQAVGQGWRLVRISLARPDGEQAASAQAARRFVAILEQDRPQSLFDFESAP